jgi:single-strand DNA-binding protein
MERRGSRRRARRQMPHYAMAIHPDDATEDAGHINVIRLVGRVADEPLRGRRGRGRPGLYFSLLVRRDPEGKGLEYDHLICVALDRAVERIVWGWGTGALVEVYGSIRRRYWTPADGAPNRCEIDVLAGRELAAPAERPLGERSTFGPDSFEAAEVGGDQITGDLPPQV